MKIKIFILTSAILTAGISSPVGAEEAVIRLDKKGTLTIGAGEVKYDDIRHFANDSRVKRVVCESGAVLPENCRKLFYEYKAKEIDISKADASQVSLTDQMFAECPKLSVIDISNLYGGTDDAEEMFADCPMLTTVYVSDRWAGVPDTYHTAFTWEGMFSGCISLEGENGTSYSEYGDDIEYARIDTKGHPGYFTAKMPEVSVKSISVTKKATLDADKGGAVRLSASISPADATFDTIVWTSSDPYTITVDENGKVTALQEGSAVITATATNGTPDTSDDKTARCTVTATSDGSTGKTHLDEKTGVLTLSGNVTREQILVYRESGKVKKIVAKKGTVLPEDCSALFARYSDYGPPEDGGDTEGPYWTGGLEYIDFSQADSSKVKYMTAMFDRCKDLKTVDLSGFDTGNVVSMDYMFYECGKLETVYVSSKWNMSGSKDSDDIFGYCYRLKGGNGTKYNEDHTDADYARIDKRRSPGYFTKKSSVKKPASKR